MLITLKLVYHIKFIPILEQNLGFLKSQCKTVDDNGNILFGFSSNNPELIEHSLRYYFFTMKDKDKMNRLYECWVFYKILDIISDLFKIKFKEVTKYNEITFEATSE